MIRLCMDTSHKKLVLALIQDDTILSYVEEDCFKKQSEIINQKLDEMLKAHQIKPLNIDEICVTKGPGSYTGVRIAMTIAKVMGAMGNIPVYTLSSLQLASGGMENTLVLMDARSKRAYYGLVDKGTIVEQGVDLIEVIESKQFTPAHFACDAYLIDKEETPVSLAESFVKLREHWELVENIHALAPEYLKSNDDYLVKK